MTAISGNIEVLAFKGDDDERAAEFIEKVTDDAPAEESVATRFCD